MAILTKMIQRLQNAHYLKSSLVEKSGVMNVDLLPYGKRCSDQLMALWHQLQASNEPCFIPENVAESPYTSQSSRTDFVHTPAFQANIEELRAAKKAQCPVVIKSILHTNTSSALDSQLQFSRLSNCRTQLVLDFFFHSMRGLEKFYNIQRERKIWWMQHSANPSRYFLDSCDLTAMEGHTIKGSQSISVKSSFPFGAIDVENITLVPLCEAKLKNPNDFLFMNIYTGRQVLPAVIRSVIDLEMAVCAMLFDGCDHSRDDTLLLHRNLVPYQCSILGFSENKITDNLRDLCSHLNFVLQRAGLRVFNENSTLATSEVNFIAAQHEADSIGIPYLLMVENESLKNGLLKLRSRDTKLAETIHISDLPAYLLNIFKFK